MGYSAFFYHYPDFPAPWLAIAAGAAVGSLACLIQGGEPRARAGAAGRRRRGRRRHPGRRGRRGARTGARARPGQPAERVRAGSRGLLPGRRPGLLRHRGEPVHRAWPGLPRPCRLARHHPRPQRRRVTAGRRRAAAAGGRRLGGHLRPGALRVAVRRRRRAHPVDAGPAGLVRRATSGCSRRTLDTARASSTSATARGQACLSSGGTSARRSTRCQPRPPGGGASRAVRRALTGYGPTARQRRLTRHGVNRGRRAAGRPPSAELMKARAAAIDALLSREREGR